MKDDLFVNFSEYKLFISENDDKSLVVISFGLRFCKKMITSIKIYKVNMYKTSFGDIV